MTRRELINRITIGGITFLVMPSVITSCSKPAADNPVTPPGPGGTPPPSGNITIDLTDPKYSALNTTGGFTVVQSIIVANLGSGNFVALSSVCTHQGCTIAFNSAVNNFPCPCHGSVFSTTGAVVNGPASTPLKAYTVSKSGNILTIQ